MEFINFIFKNRQNKRYFIIALGGSIVLFTIFKILYPFPDFFSDSYSYLFAAMANLDVNIWPIGYSKFLRVFHFITYSDTALIAFQYFFLELSCLYFFFTILYFYKPVKTNQIILFIFLFFNPLFLYVCNYLNSDPIFIALSVLWFSELLWIIQRPKFRHILLQALLLYACFTIRNNAYIYPFVTVIAFILTRLPIWIKISGSSLGVLIIIPFIMHTRNTANKMTGHKMFSLFTGWQLANNALYMYEYSDTSKQLSATGSELDNLSRKVYSIEPEDFRTNYLLPNPGNYFIQHPGSPLKIYFAQHYKVTDDYSNVVAWGKASAVFEEYGKYLILHNKSAYFHKFMIPNIKNYFIPHLEKLNLYNQGENKVEFIVQQWFHYKTNKVYTVSKDAQGIILYIFPYLFLLTNAYWIMSALVFWIREKYKTTDKSYNLNIILVGSFFIANFLFCVFATIIVMRYQIFPMIICWTSSLLLTELLEQDHTEKRKFNHPVVNKKLREAWQK